jgi:ABC-type sugar transport system substrate-binding protein
VKKTKLFSVLCLVLAAALLLCACGGAAPSGPAKGTDAPADQGEAPADKGGDPGGMAEASGPYKIGVILTSTSNGYGLTVKKHLDNLGKAFNCEFQYTAAREPEEVIAAIESFCSAGVDGIINGVTVSAPVELDICTNSNVYLVLAGNILNDPEVYAQVKDSPYYVGAVGNVDSASTYDMVTYLVKSRGVKNLALVSLPAGTSNMHDGRYEGIISAVKDNPEVTLIAESRTGNLTEGVQNIVAIAVNGVEYKLR